MGAVVGFVAGAAIIGFLAGVVGCALVKNAARIARAGWNLTPVVVVNVDVAPGTKLTSDMLSQRPVPEQFVTASVVKPDSVHYVVDQVVSVPMHAGDPLYWAFMAAAANHPPSPGIEGVAIAEACAEAVSKSRFAPPVEPSTAAIRERLRTEASR